MTAAARRREIVQCGHAPGASELTLEIIGIKVQPESDRCAVTAAVWVRSFLTAQRRRPRSTNFRLLVRAERSERLSRN